MNKKIIYSVSLLFCMNAFIYCGGTSGGQGSIAHTVNDFRNSIPADTYPTTTIRYDGTDSTKGYWTSGTASAGTYDYTQFQEFTTRSYDIAGFETYGYTHPTGNTDPWIGQDCGKPNTVGALTPAVRRWVSRFSGTIRIRGSVGMDSSHQSLGGTGTRVTLYVNGTSVYNRDLVGTDSAQYEYDVTNIAVTSGTIIDFVVMPIDTTSKIANFTSTITIQN